MKTNRKRIICFLLCVLLVLSVSGAALAAGGTIAEGVYELTTAKGGGREPVWETASLRVDAQGAMTLELLIKDSMTGIKYNGEELTAGTAVSKGDVNYITYTVALDGQTETLGLTAFVAAMNRDVALNIGLSGWEQFAGDAAASGDAVAAGDYSIQVANASTSSYGATTVYPDASLSVAQNGSCTVTVYLKDSLANIRTEDGTPVPAGEARTLTMNGAEGTYYPYSFPVEMRQAVLKVLDDVPAMSNVESMNFGKDMTTTINIDWTSAGDLKIEKLENGVYTIPVQFQTASSMLQLQPTADLAVTDSGYHLTVAFPAGQLSALSFEDKDAPMSSSGDFDRFGIPLSDELGQIPVKLTVAKMQGTPMAVQSFVIIPDWTKAEKAAAGSADSLAYSGDSVNFIKADGSAFGMLAAQEGTTAALDGDNVVIHYVPKNTTVYNAIHFGPITDAELTKDVSFNTDGTFDITLSKDRCGTLIAVAPIKAKDGATTADQYYLAVPAADKLAAAAPVEQPPVEQPPVEQPPVEQPAADSAAYTVKRGDCLWNISYRYYGTGRYFGDIAAANGIKAPYLIFAGQVLVIPAK